MNIIFICGSEDSDVILSSIESAFKTTADQADSLTAAEKNNIRVISSKAQYDRTDFIKSPPDLVIIYNKLNWKPGSLRYRGYQVAEDLMTEKLKNRFFNLQFVALEDITGFIDNVPVKYRTYVRTFHHYTFPEGLRQVSYENTRYTELHFNLIKALIIRDQDRLNMMDHDLDTTMNNLGVIADEGGLPLVKQKVTDQLEELELFKSIPVARINELKKAVSTETDTERLNLALMGVKTLMQKAKQEILSSLGVAEQTHKSPYKVVIIEDDSTWRTNLSDVFSHGYKEVYPAGDKEIRQFEILKAREIIKMRSEADIFILDLLYKDAAGCWLPFNGLDLYQQIRKLNPFAAVRIISNLPRDIVSEIAMAFDIHLEAGQVFPKKGGYTEAQHIIHDRMLELNMECKANEARRAAYNPGPVLGIFGWENKKNLLINLMETGPDYYEEYPLKALQLFKLYEKDELNELTIGWNAGQLPSPQLAKKFSDDAFISYLVTVLTHRLLVISKALQNKDRIISSASYEEEILGPVCGIRNFGKGYVNLLGFQQKQISATTIAGKKNLKIQVSFNNLFPYEYIFIANAKKQQSPKDDLLTSHPLLHSFFQAVLCQIPVQDNWHLLKLNFDPYKYLGKLRQVPDDKPVKHEFLANNFYNTVKPKMKYDIAADALDPRLTLRELDDFLKALLEKSHQSKVKTLITVVTDAYAIREESEIPEYTFKLILGLLKKPLS